MNRLPLPTYRALAVALLLGLAGCALNYYLPVTIYYKVSLLSGSILALLSLELLGVSAGILTGLLAAAGTLLLWGLPYPGLILTAEIIAIATIRRSRSCNLMIAAGLYWALFGGPLIWIVYHFNMETERIASLTYALKFCVNGLFNAMLASLILMLIRFIRFRRQADPTLRIPFAEALALLLTAVVFIPTMIATVFSLRIELMDQERQLLRLSRQIANSSQQRLQGWFRDRATTLDALRRINQNPFTTPAAELQKELRLLMATDPTVLRMGILDRQGRIVAHLPELDYHGARLVGRDFSQRPHVARALKEQQPVISEVFRSGYLGSRPQVVAMVQPLIHNNTVQGFVAALIALRSLEERSDFIAVQRGVQITVLDQRGEIAASSTPRPALTARPGISIQHPPKTPGVPWLEIMRQAHLVNRVPFGGGTSWEIVIETPYAQLVRELNLRASSLMGLLFGMMITVVLVAQTAARRFGHAIHDLELATSSLPVQISRGEIPSWPNSILQEVGDLAANSREMADSLGDAFQELKTINDTLEQRVHERTEALARAMENLQATESQLQTIFDNVHDAIYVCDFTTNPRGAIIQVNRAASEMNGYSTDELLRMTMADLDTPESFARNTPEFMAKLMSQRSGIFEREHRHKDGRPIPVEVTVNVVDVNASPLILAVIRDIQERKKYEQSLMTAKAEAEAANAAKGRFLAMMSHEIRTPMNAIIGITDLLRQTKLEPHQQELLEHAGDSAGSLLQIINDILDFSRIEANKLEIMPEPFSLRALLDALKSMFGTLAHKQQLTLSVEIADLVPDLLIGDQGRLRQVLANLLGNALKFTVEGGVQLTVVEAPPQTEDEELRVRFSIRDTGIGIDPEKQALIFDMFRQVDDSSTRRFGGTGLGLAICKQLVELMGGTIQVDSVPGQGSCFYVELPFRRATELPAAAAGPPGNQPLPQLRILLAEDHPVNQLVSRELLTNLGQTVTTVANGRELLETLAQQSFDLVLTDISMPDMDGLQAVELIRSGTIAGIDPTTPVIAMTAHALADDRQRFLQSGMDGYVAKPVEVHQLIAELRRVLPEQFPSAASAAAVRSTPNRETTMNEIPLPASDDPLDRDYLERNYFALGCGDVLIDVAKIYLESYPRKIDSLRQGLAAGNCDELVKVAHGLKGESGSVGARLVTAKAAAMEQAARRGDLEEIRRLLPELEHELKRAATALSNEFLA